MFGLGLFYNGENQHLSDSWFIIPGNREKEIRRLYKAAAEGGYIDACLIYMGILKAEGKLDEAFKFLSLNIKYGDAISLDIVSEIYLGQDKAFKKTLLNKLKGIAYYQVFLRAMGTKTGELRYLYIIKDRYLKLYSPLTDTEKRKVDLMADKYLANHTVRLFDTFWVFDE